VEKSSFVFRILIGAVFIVAYFFGFGGRNPGAGNVVFLLFGIIFAVYGFYGLVHRAAMRKKAAVKLGLPENASWADIERAGNAKP
jgi:hypothetical protein